MAHSLGIYLYSHGFDYVVMEGNSKRYSVSEAGSIMFEAKTVEDSKQLGKLIADHCKAFKVNQVCVSLPSVGVLNRDLGLPFSEREKVAQVIKYEIESELYHLDIDSVLVDFFELDDGRATSTMSVFALDKDRIASALEVLRNGDIDPPVIDLSTSSLCSALQVLPGERDKKEEAYLYIGAVSCHLLVFNLEGNLRACRTIPQGWLSLIRSSEVPLNVLEAAQSEEEDKEESVEEVAVSKLDLGGDTSLPYGIGLSEALSQASNESKINFFNFLYGEIRRALTALNYPSSPLYVLGAQIPGLFEHLNERMSVDVAPLDLGISSPEGEAVPVIALGAALRALGMDSLGMNFRQEDFRYARGLERIEGPLTWAMVGLIFYFAFGMAINLKVSQQKQADSDLIFSRAQQKVERLNQQVRDIESYPDDWIIKNDFVANDVAAEEHINLLNKAVGSAKQQLDQLMGEAAIEMPQSCFEAWRQLMNFLDAEMADYDGKWIIESLEFTSFDATARDSARVGVKFGITIFSDASGQLIGRFDRLQRNLQAQSFTKGEVAIPSTEPASVPDAKTAVVELSIVASNPNAGGVL